jgi:hypothetical protein
MTARYDVVFLSYDEPLADELCDRLGEVFGPVKRVQGVHGMRRAYVRTAAVAETATYFLADGDFEVDPSFDPATDPLAGDVAMRVWQTENAVNGLRYGYGGLKLCRRDAVTALDRRVDVLAGLPGRVEFRAAVAGRTRFNQSARHAWRAGFRECAMLTRGCEYGTQLSSARRRVARWLAGGDGPFADWSVLGARDGQAFARSIGPDEADSWDRINDPAWLDRRFHRTYPEGVQP